MFLFRPVKLRPTSSRPGKLQREGCKELQGCSSSCSPGWPWAFRSWSFHWNAWVSRENPF